jgi:hypothetical protein
MPLEEESATCKHANNSMQVALPPRERLRG